MNTPFPPPSPSPYALYEKKLPWPHLLAFLDAALEAPRGLAIHSYPSGQPLTVAQAETMRQAIGKLRKSLRERAGDTVVSYDALTISALPDLTRCDLVVRFHSPTPPPMPTLLADTRQALPPEYSLPSSACSLTVMLPSGATLQVGSEEEPCPSFSIAWRAIRPLLPAVLQITNTYAIQQEQDYDLL